MLQLQFGSESVPFFLVRYRDLSFVPGEIYLYIFSAINRSCQLGPLSVHHVSS